MNHSHPSCIFCDIVSQTIPTALIYSDDDIIAFNDLYPKAPIHQLIIPRRHVSTLNDFTPTDAALLGRLMLVAQQLAKQASISEPGYRVIMNCNKAGGQEIFHAHLHLLGG